MDERRRFERFPTQLPVRLTLRGEKGAARFEAFARVDNISLGGALVRSSFRFKGDVGALEVEITLPSGKVALGARVVRQQDDGLALQFLDVGAKQREQILKNFIPEEHQRFFKEAAAAVLPNATVDRVSLLLHLWEDWKQQAPKERPPTRRR